MKATKIHPQRRRSARAAAVTATLASALVGCMLLGTSCTSAEDSFIFLGGSEAGTGSFGSPDADATVEVPDAAVLACISTTCPEGFATCPAGNGPSYKCGADLRRDVDHCGACGNKCLHYERIHMTSRCIEGSCEIECWSPFEMGNQKDWRNCNEKVDDGCEVDVLRDRNNCGACGNACPDGLPCRDGRCGCPTGTINCDGACIDPSNDDGNCGECGHACAKEDGPCTLPDSAYYGCRNGACKSPKCEWPKGDCNQDLADPECKTDGCEVPNVFVDPNNCGGCGIKCDEAAGQKCVIEGNGPECAVPCVRYGKTACAFGECFDLLNDPNACGSCSLVCPEAGPNQNRACRKGICELDCFPGFGDCNGDPSDGCETNLMAHPGNCGTCGNACDVVGGQPCIEGKCLMTECDAGGVK